MTDPDFTALRQGSGSIPAVQSTPIMDMDGSSRASKVPIFNGTRQDDYGLWRFRLRARATHEGRLEVCQPETPSSSTFSSTSGTTGLADCVEVLEKASAIIISSIGDGPLRVIEDVDDDPQKMLRMLDERYASKQGHIPDCRPDAAVSQGVRRRLHGHICR